MALYDPKEFPAETVSPDFTVQDVLAWARTKPADEAYNYCSTGSCAIAQFLIATGRSKNPCVADDWDDDSGQPHAIDWRLRNAANSVFEETFGALVKRLEVLA
jgi:hypothetical protein